MVFAYSRIVSLAVFFGCLTVMLLFRLFYLQVVQSPALTSESLGSRVQEVPIEQSRGDILDRHGTALTNMVRRFSIVVFPSQLENARDTANQLSAICQSDSARIMASIEEGRPFKLDTGVDASTALRVNELRQRGVLAVGEKIRYSSAPFGSHLIGYINAADNQGMSGLESMFDDILRGRQPSFLAGMVDARQQLIPGLGYKKMHYNDGGEPGNVVLTIDNRIQRMVEAVMDEYITKGAVVVMRPSTGEIMAMASRPNFDANRLGQFLSSESAPLLNRAVSAYQPGSVFKLVLAAAALENKVARPHDIFIDSGFIDINQQRFQGWDFEKGGRGKISFTDAIAYSSNPVVIEVGLALGAEQLLSYADRLGFGHKTNLDFAGEASGNLPPADSLHAGDIANLSLGQGFLEATPLQIATLIATIVNDGVKVDPYLVSRLVKADGTTMKQFPLSRGTRVLSRQTAGYLRDMMKAVTHYGTGQAAWLPEVGSAGKTGTAETGRSDTKGRGLNHAWFAGYLPLDRPAYVIVVFVENGMSGSDVAAPIFREIGIRIKMLLTD